MGGRWQNHRSWLLLRPVEVPDAAVHASSENLSDFRHFSGQQNRPALVLVVFVLFIREPSKLITRGSPEHPHWPPPSLDSKEGVVSAFLPGT